MKVLKVALDRRVVVFLCVLNSALCWQIFLERACKSYCSPEFGMFNISVSRINKTTSALSGYADLDHDLPLDGIIQIELFGFYSNEYRRLPIKLRREACSIYKFEYAFIKADVHGHVPTKCPIKKGAYYVKDFIPDAKRFPRYPWTTTQYKVQLSAYRGDVLKAQIQVFARISDDDEYQTD